MDQIAVGYAADTEGRHALAWAAGVARRTGAAIDVLCPLDAGAEELGRCREVVEEVMGQAGVSRFTIEPVGAGVDGALAERSRDGTTGLVVVAHHGSRLPAALSHDPTDALVAGSRVPVAVVPDDAPVPGPQDPWTMVVGLDGTEANAEALDGIARLARELNARTVPVLAANTGVSTSRDRYGARLAGEPEAEAELAALPGAEPLREVNEPTVSGLLDVAAEEDAALIAVGAQGHHRLSELLTGTVTHRLATRAHRAVVVSPHT